MPSVSLIDPYGASVDVPAEHVDALIGQGWRPRTTTDDVNRGIAAAHESDYGGVTGALKATGAGLLRGVTVGGSDAIARLVGGEDAAYDLRALKEQNPGLSIGSEIVGGVAPAFFSGGASTPAALAGRAGRGVSAALGGGLRGAVAGGVVEGGLYGLGSGISELSLSDDPVTLERAASTLSSNALFGGALGGGAGLLAHGAAAGAAAVERGLARAAPAVEAGAAARAAQEAAGDLAGLDRAGLRAAEKTELDAIEASRVPLRQKFADDLQEFRAATKESKPFLATKDADVKGIGDIRAMSKVSLDADRQIDRLLNNPIRLAEDPRRALGALQQQEHALTSILKSEPELRAAFAADESGARMAALDAIAPTLERNRALQSTLKELTAAPASGRLAQIEAARDLLSLPKIAEREPGLAEKAAKGVAFGAIASAVSALPIVGQIPMLPHLIGAKGAEILTNLVFGRMGKATAQIAEGTQNAAKIFAGVAKAAEPYAPMVASKVLSAVRFAAEQPRPRSEPAAPAPKSLAGLFKARTDEIKTQTMFDPTGKPVMRPAAREQMAQVLKPIRVMDPILADRIETLAARRIEYLSSIIPRQPDFGTPQIGPNRWQPSDLQMRSFARSVHAVEDPAGVERRAAAGRITPEDAAAYWAVYPERALDFQRQILEQIGVDTPVPYAKRLTLGILAQKPIDPSMNPRVLSVLQGSYRKEPGSEQGTQAPKPQPAMGSLKKSPDAPTPSQARSAQGAY